ncbi:predicted protein [Sclerotinia sclerotiorum 1980 UF-70]|uniref:Uncharacterized protein n=1 Tax=Sclerotinia sclerotiorum (strain ATCC 18683 / 1980 / Ss-1) TaxID=665079 RepID=A7EL70_SCLS1|nr:predicted protein [Sclerotinia sclerotiorum 1980 UF-70]EDO03586.1 predicted protein [Sclerotinia sclerotiorum 1980 UF-70]
MPIMWTWCSRFLCQLVLLILLNTPVFRRGSYQLIDIDAHVSSRQQSHELFPNFQI